MRTSATAPAHDEALVDPDDEAVVDLGDEVPVVDLQEFLAAVTPKPRPTSLAEDAAEAARWLRTSLGGSLTERVRKCEAADLLDQLAARL